MNKEVTHMKAVFKEIPSGVINMLAKLDSRLEDKSKLRVD